MNEPFIGQIVLFLMPSGQWRPAIAVQVWKSGLLDLQVFTDGAHDEPITSDQKGHNVQWVKFVDKGRWKALSEQEPEELEAFKQKLFSEWSL